MYISATTYLLIHRPDSKSLSTAYSGVGSFSGSGPSSSSSSQAIDLSRPFYGLKAAILSESDRPGTFFFDKWAHWFPVSPRDPSFPRQITSFQSIDGRLSSSPSLLPPAPFSPNPNSPLTYLPPPSHHKNSNNNRKSNNRSNTFPPIEERKRGSEKNVLQSPRHLSWARLNRVLTTLFDLLLFIIGSCAGRGGGGGGGDRSGS